MPYFLILLGVALAYLDYQGAANVKAAGSLIYEEFTQGTSPFYKWFGALMLVGLLGYIPEMRGISTGFLVLIILAILLSHKGAFNTLVGKL